MQSKDNFTDEGVLKKIDWQVEATPVHWLRNSLIFTYLANTYIIITGEVERYTIRVAISLRREIKNNKLNQDLNILIKEEQYHAYQHACVSQDFKRHKYPVKFMTHYAKSFFNFCYFSLSLKSRFALVLAMEFYAHQLSETILEHDVFPKDQLVIYDFLRWHASEELSHSSICFNLYHYLKGGYFRRISLFILFSLYINFSIVFFMLIFLGTDIFYRRTLTPRASKLSGLFIYRNKGVFLKLLKKYLKYFKWNFRIC